MKARAVAPAALLLLAACAGPTMMVGDSPMNPEPPPPRLEVTVLAGDDGTPLAGADVRFGDRGATTDEFGAAGRTWEGPTSVTAGAAGFQAVRVEVPVLPADPIELRLAPVELRGRVTTADGRPLARTVVTLGSMVATTGDDGRYTLTRAQPGEITAERPAWEAATVDWDGTASSLDVTLEPRAVRALRVSAQAVADSAHWAEILSLAETTTVNGLVIDAKDESGTVMYLSKVATAADINAISVLYDADQVLAELRERDLYAVARIVAFQDPRLALARPELAARDSQTGETWRTSSGNPWLDPTDPGAWEYPLELAVETCTLGFDEVQFDYVRFPSDGPTERLEVDGQNTAGGRVDAVTAFLVEARARLSPLGCAVSAAVLGIVASVGNEQGVGQRFETLADAVDVISPQVYPSLYGPGWLGYDNPGDFPSEVVGQALDAGLPRIEGATILRPWLQGNNYGVTEIAIEISEAEERGLGWMLWNAAAEFSRSSLPAAQAE